MKLWQSVSTRLTLTLLTVTLGSLGGLYLSLDFALRRLFINDAQARLYEQAEMLAEQVPSRLDDPTLIRQMVDMASEQMNVDVVIFDAAAAIAQATSQSGNGVYPVEPPAEVISGTLAGTEQAGVLRATDPDPHPQWLYITVPIRDAQTAQIMGGVYVAMPFRRPQEFAERVAGLVMGIALAATVVATITGLLLSRTITQPLKALHRQAHQLEAGDYSARSALKGRDELAQLSRSLDQMADKLMGTLNALQAQEIARRELVANVSHDLRTPLTALRVELEAVLDGVVSGQKAEQYLQQACRETDYLNRLVDQLLLLARVDAGQLQVRPQAVSAIAIAQECFSRMHPYAAQAGIQLELGTPSLKAMVLVDPELTGQAVLNLLDNAIKYAPDSELIRLNILPPIEKEQHQFIPLQIEDTGKGMNKDTLQKVVDRFYRADNSRPKGGIGLGLAIAQHICQLQGGSLDIESELGKGTRVTLFLPMTKS
ncbi:MAG: HAMP domain-containing sensor histidine kinase [Cyanobacteria bacterium J06638_22]